MKKKYLRCQLVTAVTRYLGIWLNLKMVLYLENLCIMEKTRIFNPKHLVAPRRQAVKKPFFHLNFPYFPIATTQIEPFKKAVFFRLHV